MQEHIGYASIGIGDGETLNHLIPEEQREAIDTLWKTHGMKGRVPKSYLRKIMRLESAGVDVSSVSPPNWGKPAPDWALALTSGEGAEEAHSEWKRGRICDSLSGADMAAGAQGAAAAKLKQSEAIITGFKLAHSMSAGVAPRAIEVAKWWIETQGLPTKEKPNLVKRLKRTELVR